MGPTPTPTQAVLSEDRFKVLDRLLDRTGLYTQFLTEQLADLSEKPPQDGGDAKDEGAAAQGKGKGAKRKGGKDGAAATKRQKKGAQDDAPAAEGVGPTQASVRVGGGGL